MSSKLPPELSLCNALQYRDLEECERLINCGTNIKDAIVFLQFRNFDINDKDINGNSLLHFAQNLHFSLTEELLKTDININAKNNFDETVFHMLLKNNHFNNKFTEMYLSANVDINAKDNNLDTIVHLLLKKFDPINILNNLKYLIDKNADINSKNKFGKTPLDLAIFMYEDYDYGPDEMANKIHKIFYKECIELLVERGACIGVLDHDSRIKLENITKIEIFEIELEI